MSNTIHTRAQHFIHANAQSLAPLLVSFARSESISPAPSAIIGAAQEITLAQKLMDYFPFAHVIQTSKTAKSMDILVEIPTDDGEKCKIAIESKYYNTSNVPSAEIQKFERDHATLDVHGSILIAKRRVDVFDGYSTRIRTNLSRASPTTYYVDNDDFGALVQAIMRIYAYSMRVDDIRCMASLNTVWNHMATYMKSVHGVFDAIRGPVKKWFDEQNVLAAPVVEALMNVREEMSGTCIEQVVSALQIRGKRSVKRKRTSTHV
jgi:hypothetical protein